MNKPTTICALYTRVSSRNQLDPEYGSLQTQRERLEAYCRSQDNYQVFRVYEDGAYSAESIDRPALQEMLADIRTGKINCVLAYKIDRLTRSVKDFHLLMELFDRYNVKFVSITQCIDTQHPMGRLLRNILLDFAQFEREMTADRTRDKMHQRAQKGMWNGGGVPYGYRNVDKKLVPDPDKASHVRFVYEFFANDPSLARLRAEVTRRGWTTPTGRQWTKSGLDYMLHNQTYLGKVRGNGQYYPGTHAPIIDEVLFQRVHAVRPERTHTVSSNKRPFLLKGLLSCSDCGSTMSPHYTQKRRKDGSVYRIPYYRCTSTMKYNNGVCRIKQLNADQSEQTVIESLTTLSQDDLWLNTTIEELNRNLKAKVAPLLKEQAQIKVRMVELDQEIDNFVHAVGKGTISVDRLEREIEKRKADNKDLQTRHNVLQQRIQEEAAYEFNAETVKRNLTDFGAVFGALSPEEKKEALQCMLQKVTVYPEKLVLDVYELTDFKRGSTNHQEWLPR